MSGLGGEPKPPRQGGTNPFEARRPEPAKGGVPCLRVEQEHGQSRAFARSDGALEEHRDDRQPRARHHLARGETVRVCLRARAQVHLFACSTRAPFSVNVLCNTQVRATAITDEKEEKAERRSKKQRTSTLEALCEEAFHGKARAQLEKTWTIQKRFIKCRG